MTTLDTGTGVTVTVAVAERPSAVAVIVVVPAPIAVTLPDAETVAMVAAAVLHVTGRPVSAAPAASRAAAVSVQLPPTTKAQLAGVTVSAAMGMGVTVMVAVPLRPSLVAVIEAEPGATALTTPFATVAIVGADVAHDTLRSLRTRPAASVGAATNVHVAAGTRAQVVGVTVTDATGAGVVPPPGVVGVPLPPSPLAHADSPKARAAARTAGTGTTGSRITVVG
jgi:hypothetical protein